MIEIDDLLILIFFIWIFYDTCKHDGFLNAFQLIVFILTLSLFIVLIPYFFGDTGKIIMYASFAIVGAFFHLKKRER